MYMASNKLVRKLVILMFFIIYSLELFMLSQSEPYERGFILLFEETCPKLDKKP
jgi:hypothetical protein